MNNLSCMKRLSYTVVLMWALMSVAHIPSVAAEKDVAGSADHPLIGRYEGSWIRGYKLSEFDEYKIVTGITSKRGENVITLEGRVTEIAYHISNEVSVLQLFRNYQAKILDTGFEEIFECSAKNECGADFRNAYRMMPIPKMWGSADYRYLAAKTTRPEGQVYATLYCESLGGSGKNACQVAVIEIEAMAHKMVDAAQMAESIAERGGVALYGIYFDFDKAVVKPGSKPTLDQIAELLKSNAGLKLVVVGHTDNKGSLDYNTDLSKRRAQAVANALIRDYGIARGRLEHRGVGYLAPMASNRTEEGRAKNRRVELVER